MKIEDLDPEFDPQIILREKQKARKLRQTQWWKNKRANNKCFYCETDTPARKLTMDHLVPLSRGGRSIKSNLVPCCKSCNNNKKNLLPLEWKKFLNNF
tara:strand:+ start:2806 stop:3099 length:294 start_codon:yes stop_codon:yes gene_type:complete